MAEEAKNQEPVYFWKPDTRKFGPNAIFSQWFLSTFTGDEKAIYDLTQALGEHIKFIKGQKFICREQWMMAHKALIFAFGKYTKVNLEIYHKILSSNSQREMQKLGREVQGFIENEELWLKWRYEVVVNGNFLQFSQGNKLQVSKDKFISLKQILLNTGSRPIVEASPYDKIWGVGYTAEDAIANRDKWPGKNTRLNLLGKALMEVRSALVK
jgi:ribA/ribD-fused uncharacterized protein